MQSESDQKFVNLRMKPNGEHIVKLKQDDGLEADTDLKNTKTLCQLFLIILF